MLVREILYPSNALETLKRVLTGYFGIKDQKTEKNWNIICSNHIHATISVEKLELDPCSISSWVSFTNSDNLKS